jgi:hypothetical protein
VCEGRARGNQGRTVLSSLVGSLSKVYYAKVCEGKAHGNQEKISVAGLGPSVRFRQESGTKESSRETGRTMWSRSPGSSSKAWNGPTGTRENNLK